MGSEGSDGASKDARRRRNLKALAGVSYLVKVFWKGTAYFPNKFKMAGAAISAADAAHASFPHKCSSAASVEPESFPVSFWRSNLHILNNDAPCSSQGDDDLSSMAKGGAGNSDAINEARSHTHRVRTTGASTSH